MNQSVGLYEVVYYANGMLDAETVKLFLESQGLAVIITQESVGVTYGLTIGSLGEARVWVPKSQVPEAIKLIQQMERGEFIANDSPDLTGQRDTNSGG